MRELFQANQRSAVRHGDHLFDGVWVFEAGVGDHAEDVGVGGEAVLSFPDFGIGDGVAAAAGGSAFGGGSVAVVNRRNLQADDASSCDAD